MATAAHAGQGGRDLTDSKCRSRQGQRPDLLYYAFPSFKQGRNAAREDSITESSGTFLVGSSSRAGDEMPTSRSRYLAGDFGAGNRRAEIQSRAWRERVPVQGVGSDTSNSPRTPNRGGSRGRARQDKHTGPETRDSTLLNRVPFSNGV